VSRLLNKVAFITGAAGGIGLAAAKLFLQEGASVIMADRDADLLEDARASMEELTNAEGSFNIVKTDVTSQQEIEQICRGKIYV